MRLVRRSTTLLWHPRSFSSGISPERLEKVELEIKALSSASQMATLAERMDHLEQELQEIHDYNEKERKRGLQPFLQGIFFFGSIVGIALNLWYAGERESRQQHVAAIKLSFEVMNDPAVTTLRRLVSRQPVIGFFSEYRRTVNSSCGGYKLPNDLDRIDACIALRPRIGCKTNSAWVSLAGESHAQVLMVPHDDVRETILRALTKMATLDYLLDSKAMSFEMVPDELKIELEMLGGVGKFAPKSEEDRMFLAAVHDFVGRRRQAHPFYSLIDKVHPGWEPQAWKQDYDDLLVELYRKRSSKPRRRIPKINDESAVYVSRSNVEFTD